MFTPPRWFLFATGGAGMAVAALALLDRAAAGWVLAVALPLALGACGLLQARCAALRQTYHQVLARLTGQAAQGGSRMAHVAATATLARRVARRLRLRPREAEITHVAALLHDIGELHLDPRLVQKVYRGVMLTDSESQAYRQHPVLGEELVAPLHGLEPVAAAIRHHHEHWDGTGYPDGLRGPDIPLTARIVGAVEAYLHLIGRDLPADPNVREQQALGLAGTVADPTVAAALGKEVREFTLPAGPPAAAAPDGANEGLYGELFPGELRESVRQSRLLEHLGIGRIYRYRSGRFTDGDDNPATPPMHRSVARLAARCLAERRVLREHVVAAEPERVLDVYCFPVTGDSAGVLLFEVTAVLAAEREELRRLQRAYGDVIAAVTRGRMRLVFPTELPALVNGGEWAGAVELDTVDKNRTARELVAQVLTGRGFTGPPLFRVQVAVAEAVGNVFKHAGSGHLELRALPSAIRAIVSDQGPGIPLDVLPQAFLVDGFSTKTSLGKGYTLMLNYVDRLLIATGHQGTTLVLEKDLPGGERSDA